MSTINWGMLAKSQIDPEKIEEAIVRLIAEHRADETAHLGPGESLQSHKASEIIDHLAASIIADKIKNREIETDKLTDFGKFRVSLSLETMSGWDISAGVSSNVGEFLMLTGNIINTVRYANADSLTGATFSRLFVSQFRLQMQYSGNQIFYAVVGSAVPGAPEIQFVGFKILDTNAYAVIQSGPPEEAQEYSWLIPGIDITKPHLYLTKYYPGSKIEFYIDDILRHTITENLPDPSWGDGLFASFYLKNTIAFNRSVIISQVYFSQPNP